MAKKRVNPSALSTSTNNVLDVLNIDHSDENYVSAVSES